MKIVSLRRWRHRSVYVAVAAISSFPLTGPALAQSCVDREIAAMSVEGTADFVWAHSDVIGFGYISTVNSPEREQQFVDMVAPLKGRADRYAFAPLRLGRVAFQEPGYQRRQEHPGEIAFVSLVQTDRGYITPACRNRMLTGERSAAVIRAIYALSRRGGQAAR